MMPCATSSRRYKRFYEEERQIALAVLEGLILKHRTRQSELRTSGAQAAPAKSKKIAQHAKR